MFSFLRLFWVTMNRLNTSINELLSMMSFHVHLILIRHYIFFDPWLIEAMFWSFFTRRKNAVGDVTALGKTIRMMVQTFSINGCCSLVISWRVLQTSRKLNGTDCLKTVGRVSSSLCNFCGLKHLEKSDS